MATARETVTHVLEQLEPLAVRSRPMFGEYCLWCDEKAVALICNDTVFLKPTAASNGRGMCEAEAYQGSKLFRVVEAPLIEDSGAFRALVKATADELPVPRPRRPRASRGRADHSR